MPPPIRQLAIGDRAPETPVLDQQGESISLTPFWQASPNGAVVVFLRHFGCIFCREHAIRLRKHYEQFQERNLAVVAIGLGSPDDARGFAEWLKLPYPVLAAPDTAIYADWGLGTITVAEMMRPAVFAAGLRALTQRATQGKNTGDSKQLPGSFIVSSGSIVEWSYPAKHPGDTAPIEQILIAADAIAKRR